MRISKIPAFRVLLLRGLGLMLAGALFFLPARAVAQVSVTISPSAINLTLGATEQFAAVVAGSSNTAVTWSVQETNGGTINASGLYTAPLVLGEYHVVATSQADATKSATAVVALPGFVTFGLNNAHEAGTATLLANGKILYTGGTSSGCASTNAEVYDPLADLSIDTPPMVVARCAHTATLLPSGQVLLAGGQTNGGDTATAELYDPVANTFTATGSMQVARAGHAATLLSNGTVLIAGGSNCTSTCATTSEAEIYNPGTGAFTVTGSMSVPRNGAYASALPSGGALIAGGTYCATSASCVVYTSAEIYNPGSATFGPTGSMVTAGQLGAAVTLANGNVLIVDGIVNEAVSSTSEIYIPSTGQFTSTGSLNVARSNETLTLLQDGTVLVLGGVAPQTLASTAEIYNPTSASFSLSGSLLQPAINCIATLAPSGQVVVIAGGTDTQFYNPGTKIFTSHSSYLNVVRFDHTATTLQDGRVLLAGGLTNGQGGVTATAEIYDPATGLFVLTGSMSSPRAYHTATLLPDGTVLIIGGFSNPQLTTIVPTAEIFSPTQGTFSLAAGSPNTPRAEHTATLLPSGEVLLLGGQSFNPNSPALASAELYDPVMQSFGPAGNMTVGRYGHTATLMNDGQILIAGGIPSFAPFYTPPANAAPAELYNPTTSVFTPLTSATNSFSFPGPNSNNLYTQFDSILLPSGDVLASLGFIYDPTANAFTAIPTGSSPAQGYKFTNLPNGQVLVVGGAADLFDPTSLLFSPSLNDPVERTSPTADLLSTGQVLVAGGSDFSLTRVDFYQPAVAVPAPTVASVSPNPVTGFSSVTITVLGSNFAPGAVVADDFVGGTLQTTFVSDTELTAVFPQSSLLVPGNHTVFVQNIQDARFASTTLNVVNPQMASSTASGVTTGFFGSVNLGANANQAITFTNQGNATLTLNSFAISGTNMADFTVNAPGTSCPLQGGTLAALTSCTITIQFAPSAVGLRAAELTASYETPTSPMIIALSGTGVGLSASSISPASLTFGDQNVGTSSTAQRVTVLSTGTAPLAISNIAVTSGYQTSNNCPQSLAINASCSINVVFAPTSSGSNVGTLSIFANDSSTPHAVSLSGTGIGVSTSAIAPTSLTFGSQAVGISSAAQQVTIASIGTGNLQISSIALTDTADFKQTNNCPASLGPNTNCSVSVTFAPSTTGNITGSLVITANDGSPHTIPLSGTGTNFSIGPASGSSSSSTVTAGQTASYQMSLSPQVFSGTVNLTCTEPTPIPNTTCTVTPTQVSLSGNTPVPVTVSVSTMAQNGLAAPRRWMRFPYRMVPGFGTMQWLLLMLAALAVLAAMGKTRRRIPLGMAALLLCALLATGCGSSSSYGGGGTGGTTGTPTGSYQLVVSASSAGVTRTMTLTLVVQQ